MACTRVGRARRVVLAALRRAPARRRAGRARIGSAAIGAPRSCVRRLRRAARPGRAARAAPPRRPASPRSASSAASGRATRTKSWPGRQVGGGRPERLAQQPLHPVALDRAAHLAADRDAEPGAVAVVRARERVEHEVAARVRAALAVDALELGAAREPAPAPLAGAAALGARALAPCSGRQPLAALAAAALEDRSPAARAHARAEPVRAGPLALLGLVGALHRRSRRVARRGCHKV